MVPPDVTNGTLRAEVTDSDPALSTDPSPPPAPPFIVGIGASAGGLEALEELFEAMPEDSGAAFVVIQHLSPDHPSLMDELLGRRTAMPVHQAEDHIRLTADTVHIIPPGKELSVEGLELRVHPRPPSVLRFPIDQFFRSMAQAFGDRCVAIILSGTGTDGTRGVQHVRDAGGLVLVQDETSAKFSGMPVSATMGGHAHAVLAPDQMPPKLVHHIRHPRASEDLTADQARVLKEITTLLLNSHDLDLSQYKRMNVLRRVERRQTRAGLDSLAQYADRLQSEPPELARLHQDMLIGVTEFFRDPSAFRDLEKALPSLFARGPDGGVRVWVPGCATGEEAYSLAALLHERATAMKIPLDNVKVFATDINRESLARASSGIYADELVEACPEPLRQHFEPVPGGYQVTATLRRMIVFAQHNLLKDPPFTRLDLISCRNVLIYLTPHAQRRILSLFQFALRTTGLLFLGPSESLGEGADDFETVSVAARLFRKRRETPPTERLPLVRPGGSLPHETHRKEEPTVHAAFHTLLQRYAPPAILVDERFQVVHVFGAASDYLTLPPGRTSLEISAVIHPQLRSPVKSALLRAQRLRAPTSCRPVRLQPQDQAHRITVRVEPIRDRRVTSDVFLVSLERTERAPRAAPVAADPEDNPSQARIQMLQEELRATEERLENTIEELETSNEELQVTNEQLMSSNEEMQSTNEELQSVNEELYTVNAEHQRKITELVELNHDLDNFLKSTSIETLFLDRDLRIRRYTPSIAESFSLLPADLGRPLGHLASNLRYGGVLDDARTVLETESTIEREVQNRSGRWLSMLIRPYRTSVQEVDGVVVTFADISARKATASRFEAMARTQQAVMDTLPELVFVFDEDGERVLINTAARRFLSLAPGSPDPWRIDGEDLRAAAAQVRRTGESMRGRRRLDWGPQRWLFEYRLVLVPSADSSDSRLICLARDLGTGAAETSPSPPPQAPT